MAGFMSAQGKVVHRVPKKVIHAQDHQSQTFKFTYTCQYSVCIFVSSQNVQVY